MDIEEQFKTCEYFHEPYQFILYKNKIYCCPTEPHMIENLNLPDDPKCYINISDLKSEEDLMKLVSEGHNICKYCRDKNMGNDVFPWSAGNFKNKNYNFKSLKDLYLYNYDEYFNLLNDINSIKSISEILTNANKYI
ncbi:MAG: hypothetical protein E7167_01120 [Firmicutes bacterium]|nr:hypothetical protein [Bacillota bacterium]